MISLGEDRDGCVIPWPVYCPLAHGSVTVDRKTPFVAVAQVSEVGHPERWRPSPIAGFRRRARAALAQHSHPGTVVCSDPPMCFPARQRQGRLRDAGLSWVSTPLGNVKRVRRQVSLLWDTLRGLLSGRIRLQSALPIGGSGASPCL